MLGTILDAIRFLREVWPKRWSNVETRVLIDELGVVVSCRGKGRGLLGVTLENRAGRVIAQLEGENRLDGEVRVGCNSEGVPESIFVDVFRMARCDREFERTGVLEHSRYSGYFRTRTVFRWERLLAEEAAAEAGEEAAA